MDTIKRMKRWAPVAITGVIVAGMLTAATTFAWAGAAQPADSEPIDACVSQGLFGIGSGLIRVVDDPSQCRPNEEPLSWNRQGPEGVPGPEGPQGEPGPQGQEGPPGPGGIPGYEVIRLTEEVPGPGLWTCHLDCGPSKRPLSGGLAPGGTVTLHRNYPSDPFEPERPESEWGMQVLNESAGEATARMYVVCADLDG